MNEYSGLLGSDEIKRGDFQRLRSFSSPWLLSVHLSAYIAFDI